MSTTTNFSVNADDGVRIQCYYDKHPRPLAEGLVILAHGRLDNAHMGPLAALPYQEQLFDTLRIDQRGMGASEGTTTYDNAPVEARDISKIISVLPKEYGPVLAIVGHSQGSSATFFQALNNPNISPPLLVNVSGRYDTIGIENRLTPAEKELVRKGPYAWKNYKRGEPGNLREETYYITQDKYDSYMGTVMDNVSELDAKFKVLNIHGRADGTVLPSNATKFDAAIRRGKATSDIMLLEGVNHGWTQAGETELLGQLIGGWIKRRHGMKFARVDEDKLVDGLGKQK